MTNTKAASYRGVRVSAEALLVRDEYVSRVKALESDHDRQIDHARLQLTFTELSEVAQDAALSTLASKLLVSRTVVEMRAETAQIVGPAGESTEPTVVVVEALTWDRKRMEAFRVLHQVHRFGFRVGLKILGVPIPFWAAPQRAGYTMDQHWEKVDDAFAAHESSKDAACR